VKILHLEAGRHLYGGARQAGYLINGLAARGIENLLVCAEGQPLAVQVAGEVFEWRLGGDLDFSLGRRLSEFLQEKQPDLVHVHSRRGADSFGGRAAARVGVPSILTRRVQSSEPGFVFRFKARPYAVIVAISSAVEQELLEHGVAAERIRRIPSAVDSTLFRPDAEARARLIARYRLPDDALIAGAASQLIPRKGLELLLPVAARLKLDAPEFRLLLFGQGPERHRLEREVRALGLDGRVVFCGFAPEWPALVPGLDLFLHPARREGLGVAVLEAMSAGVPVIAAAAGGVVDLIEDGVDGRLVSPHVADAWYSTIRELLANRERRDALADVARRTVAARFTIERMTDSYITLYKEVLGHGGG
jgi:glycosyltransferase involved in cell wall biosynthesis